MMDQSVTEAVAKLRELEEKRAALYHAMGVVNYDALTAAPKDTAEGRGRTMGVLSGMEYKLTTGAETVAVLDVLTAHIAELDEQTAREVQLMKKANEQISRIPAEEYTAYSVLVNDAQSVWQRAKNENDFAAFEPYLEKIVAYNRTFAGYYNPDMKPYDALLNEYEEGMTMEVLDGFFENLRAVIVPLLRRVMAAPAIDDSFLHRSYPIEKQRVLSDMLMEVLGIDRSHCSIGETEHPFTDGFNNKDVRITTHYHEHELASSMYSVIHEGGHAIYELGCEDRFNYTAAAGGVSMGIHESQSRFFENIIGRSRAFIGFLFPKIRELFPEQLADVDAEMFYRAVNKAEPSLIRTESDELTYALHIMVRYEIEKRLIDGSLAVHDLPAAWNALYREYLGIDVPDDRSGCLQDSHWSGGAIGYFPSYALGSAYGAQMLHCMEAELPGLWEQVAAGNLAPVKEWLREHIHRYASLYAPGELFERACGKFDAAHFAAYLTDKYTALYGLKD